MASSMTRTIALCFCCAALAAISLTAGEAAATKPGWGQAGKTVPRNFRKAPFAKNRELRTAISNLKVSRSAKAQIVRTLAREYATAQRELINEKRIEPGTKLMVKVVHTSSKQIFVGFAHHVPWLLKGEGIATTRVARHAEIHGRIARVTVADVASSMAENPAKKSVVQVKTERHDNGVSSNLQHRNWVVSANGLLQRISETLAKELTGDWTF